MLSYLFKWLVVEANQVLRTQCSHGVGSSLIVAEFDFGHGGGEYLNNGSYLTAHETLLGHVVQHSDFGK